MEYPNEFIQRYFKSVKEFFKCSGYTNNSEDINILTGTTYDLDGYDKDGWNKDNKYKGTGTIYDGEGYDRDGYNEKGWNKDTSIKNNKFTNKPYDLNGNDRNNDKWYDENGYDYLGLDVNGFEYITPVDAALIADSSLFVQYGQVTVTAILADGSKKLSSNAQAVLEKFNYYDETNVNLTIKSAVVDANDDYLRTGFTTGDQLVGTGISVVNKSLVAMMGQMESTDSQKLKLITDIFRTRAYVNHRGHGDFGSSIEELNGLYNQLDITAAQFDGVLSDYYEELANQIKTNPGLIKTLFNQMQGFEQFYANRDDAIDLGLAPIMEGSASNYSPAIEKRSLVYTDYLLSLAQQSQSQGQDLSR